MGTITITELFKEIDSMQADSFADALDEDCIFQYANMSKIKGKDNIRNFVQNFFASINKISHTVSQQWSIDNAVICKGEVSYTRIDKSILSVPFANILTINDDKIIEYLIFVDASELFTVS